MKTSEDESSSQMSLSEINDDLISNNSKPAKRDTRQQQRFETAFSPKTEGGNSPGVDMQFLQHFGTQLGSRQRTGSNVTATDPALKAMVTKKKLQPGSPSATKFDDELQKLKDVRRRKTTYQ